MGDEGQQERGKRKGRERQEAERENKFELNWLFPSKHLTLFILLPIVAQAFIRHLRRYGLSPTFDGTYPERLFGYLLRLP